MHEVRVSVDLLAPSGMHLKTTCTEAFEAGLCTRAHRPNKRPLVARPMAIEATGLNLDYFSFLLTPPQTFSSPQHQLLCVSVRTVWCIGLLISMLWNSGVWPISSNSGDTISDYARNNEPLRDHRGLPATLATLLVAGGRRSSGLRNVLTTGLKAGDANSVF